MSDHLQDLSDSLDVLALNDKNRILQIPTKITSHEYMVEKVLSWRYNYHDKPYELMDLVSYSSEYNTVEKLFDGGFRNPPEINNIQRVENALLFAQYQMKKSQKQTVHGDVSEHTLFHGTKEENIDSICRSNFDWRKMGSSGYRYSKYGCGVSFSPSSSYASDYPRRCYPRERIMFVVKVLEVSRCEGEDDLIIPPEPHDVSVSCDENVFVKFFDNEFYPEYIIRYCQ